MPIKNDGTLPSGSRVLTIGAVSYIADDFTVNEPTKFLDGRDEHDEPTGGVLLADFMKGSATLQLAASTTVNPALGAIFSAKINANDSVAANWMITEVSKPENRGSLQKVTISFQKAYVATS